MLWIAIVVVEGGTLRGDEVGRRRVRRGTVCESSRIEEEVGCCRGCHKLLRSRRLDYSRWRRRRSFGCELSRWRVQRYGCWSESELWAPRWLDRLKLTAGGSYRALKACIAPVHRTLLSRKVAKSPSATFAVMLLSLTTCRW